MKTINVSVDWLSKIDGLTVAQAIAYLSTLPSDHVLSYWQSSGDDQGVEISSQLSYQRLCTKKELAELAAIRNAKKIKDCEASIAYYDKKAAYWDGYDNCRAAIYRRNAELCRQQLEELK